MQRYTGVPFDYKPKSTRKRSKRKIRGRWILIAFLLSLVGGLAAYMPARDTPPAVAAQPSAAIATAVPAPVAAEPVRDAPIATAPAAEPAVAASPPRDEIELVVRRNDTLDRIFRRLDLNSSDLNDILNVPGVRRKLNRIKPGDKLTVVRDAGTVYALNRRISDTEVLNVTRDENGFTAKVITTPIETRTAYASGTIDTSLFAAARDAGVSAETVLRLANDIFGWDIDFALDIRPGDRFTMIFERKYRDGRYIGDGRILAAEFINDGDTYRAVRYSSPDGEIDDYFTPEGRSVRRQFLRAPLDFTRISSNFNLHRRHPVLNIIRAHQGVDYAAPIGTAVKAAGDGRVGFVGWKGGYGRAIVLEHGGGISTLYGHLSRFAHGLHSGERVKQGETIGYVGRSGLATGPHLHYEYRINGVHKNPRTVHLPDAAPLPTAYLPDFKVKAAVLLTALEQSRGTAVATAQAN